MVSQHAVSDGYFCPEIFEEMIKCTICLETFKDPVITKCQHTFCGSCIQDLFDKESSCSVPKPKHVKCPNCRKRIRIPKTPKEGLPTNTLILKILDILKAKSSGSDMLCDLCKGAFAYAVVFCRQCNARYCSKCSLAHNEFNKYHSVSSLENASFGLSSLGNNKYDVENNKFCQIHRAFEIDSFCCDKACQHPICEQCEKDHKYHPKIPLAEKALEAFNVVKECEKRQKFKIEKLELCNSGLTKQLDKLETDALKAKEQVEETADYLERLIKEQKESHHKEIDNNLSTQKKDIKTQMERVQTEIASRKSLLPKTEALTKQHNAILVHETPSHIEKYENIAEENVDDLNVKYKHCSLRFLQFQQNAARIQNGLGKVICGLVDNTPSQALTPRHFRGTQSEITGITFGNEASENRSGPNSICSESSSNITSVSQLDEVSTLVPMDQRPFRERKPGRIDEWLNRYIKSTGGTHM